jgi:hypothetical protein
MVELKNNELTNNDCTKENTNKYNKKNSNIPFWTENPNILFDAKYIFEFFPTNTMTYTQKLNTVTRVILIISIFLFVYSKNIWVIIVGAITIFSIYLYYKNTIYQDKLFNEGYDNPAQVLIKQKSTNIPQTNEIFSSPNTKNPFNNVMVTDYEYNTLKKPAPPSTNEITKIAILDKAKDLVKEQNPGQPDITEKLFKDLNEELNFEQSLRPFHSMANTTIPNDQAGFAEFCYGSLISCKEGNLFACAKNNSHYTLY